MGRTGLILWCLAGCLPVAQIEFPPEEPLPPPLGVVVEPEVIDFGSVDVGKQATTTITLHNEGAVPVPLGGLTIDEAARFSFDDPVPAVLHAGAEVQLDLTFIPADPLPLETRLRVPVRDGLIRAVPMVGLGVGPSLQIEPDIHSFGVLAAGCSDALTVVLRNVGNGGLTIDDISYDQEAGSGLTMELPDGWEGYLGRGESVAATVHYAPNSAGVDHGVMIIESDDPLRPTLLAEQTGLGTLEPQRRDEFEVPDLPAVDVLFAVRGGPNMAPARQRMVESFGTFVATANALDLDWRVGVVSMSEDDEGSLQGDVPWFDPSSDDPERAFQVALEELATGQQAGLHNAYVALSAPESSAANSGFVREEAGLRVVLAARGADSSVGVWGWQPPQYADAFVALKPAPDSVRLSAISGGLAGCSSSTDSASPATDYVLVANMTGGLSHSICDPSGHAAMADLALNAQHWSNAFQLSAEVMGGTAEVYVDGAPAAGWAIEDDWLVFEAASAPAGGAVVEVEYVPTPEGC